MNYGLSKLIKHNLQIALTQAICPITREALRTVTAEEFSYQIHISDKYKYVYVGNPKTGGSTLKSALLELEIRNSDIHLDATDQHSFNSLASPLKFYPPFWPNKTLSRLSKQNYRFITFVRNPYTRLKSCYINKFVNKTDNVHQSFYSHFGENPKNFNDFITKICTQPDRLMNPHWRPQHCQIHYGSIQYTHIGKFENFLDDFLKIFDILGVPQTDTPAARHLNQSRSSQKKLATYDTDTANMVFERYRRDFELFGYPEIYSNES